MERRIGKDTINFDIMMVLTNFLEMKGWGSSWKENPLFVGIVEVKIG
jgi:hypothetical protein